MSTADDSVRFCSDLLAGMADVGVTRAFISPGSRNTPLALAAVAEPRIDTTSVRDERSAGFMAVGWAKATETPAIVICTSGSAAAHYYPAIVEADQSGVPMIALTSDRPLRLRGTGAPQTMDQHALYGPHVVTSIDGETIDDPRDAGRTAAGIALGAADEAPGPVHVNLPFDEPLVPTTVAEPPAAAPIDRTHATHVPSGLFADLAGKRVMIVASGRNGPGFADAVDRFARTVGAPILADPQVTVTGPNVIQHPDLLIGAQDDEGSRFVLDALAPDVVIRLGPLPTSKPLWEWMERGGIPQIHIERSRLRDPLGSATTTVLSDPGTVLLSEPAPQNPETYLGKWKAIDHIAGDALDAALARLSFPNEPETARITADHAPPGTTLFVASSRPIRDVDAFGRRRDDRIVLANRGVNGIDGTISTAAGVALSSGPVVLFIGDVAFLHDATAVAEASRLELPMRIVAVNNDGGGIFEFLPQARSDALQRSDFERLWATPHGLSLAAVSEALGMRSQRIEDPADLRAAVAAPIDRPEMIEVVTDRSHLVDDHQAVRRAVAEALRRGDEIQ
ncbi:MAG: 2-succinyl-5-enolpyruvyl-6-hydroxy-3-cyclohexene-1-carboxylic-acid synthase [Acidimicrobiia bacterium]|nr:2-succinyl-5-enolpyruvyl-6-hydroxy-3-cyclohexene-1-carboxylic-acid synthase [Acidimicrobiia bacterium]